ncbi:MAG: glycoside hydrolase family 43 protein [Bifidobacterium scardovii]|uniref:glycoside hydrolase family 43 protein n=1 Tax=Bifidobacterium scardovii TaxID=158787 RepID=UPI000667C83A|nr:glycoside hydrolase family 43 protein [Bifidobacterium scardovii]MBS6947365.1 glycoside hydrolase family 43 protein [Bifidobacterium scardovii]MDU3736428.1 glycoside hydrolase family 43 protein [Bifidobacterium scardovii]MDU5297052.1 glycoside hydrolase family 43 protein [Bifidobacterium scardovii]MDU5611341.1 glycoside hydrolase family 43 protein [Bifidobacterium scardovii]MDU5886104.1 glycoside hydrolase family 43 protein [Bifidobacterium scardovii]
MSISHLPQPQPPADPYGYLLVHFIEDPDGYAERIYLDLSDGDNPERWNPLNGGKPILTSPLGTTGVRDPYLTRNPETGRVYVIATDLRVFDPDADQSRQNWETWSHHGSTNLIIWHSDDLVHWSEPHTLDVSARQDGTHAQLGMAWAPEALWVPDYYPEGHEGGRGAFVLYWSSKLFADDDPEHLDGRVYDRVLWGATSDFTDATYAYGGVFIDAGAPTIDTTMLQRALPDGTIRTYRATKNNGPDPNIWLDRTDVSRWWEPGVLWTPVQRDIGAEWTESGNPGGVEGPALFASHSDDRVYLYVDVIPSIGYRPMVTVNPDGGFDYLRSDDFFMAPHTKHGGVLSLSRAEYERLKAADGTIG